MDLEAVTIRHVGKDGIHYGRMRDRRFSRTPGDPIPDAYQRHLNVNARVGGFISQTALLLSIAVCLAVATFATTATAEVGGAPVPIYFFWGDGCPSCEAEKPFLAELQRRFPGVEVHDFEVWFDEANRDFYLQMAQAYAVRAIGVPATFVGDAVWLGYSDDLKTAIEDKVRACSASGCPDPRDLWLEVQSTAMASTDSVPATELPSLSAQTSITVPFVGTIDLAAQSLVITTVLIAFVDGFNPCSLWVLSLLLAIVIYSGSRKRIVVVGATFLAVTAVAYGAFIAGLFNVFAYVGYLGWIQVAVALMALAFALINIKDYFWFRQGVSLTISERHKSKIYQHIRHIMTSGHSTSAVMGATAVMALGITLVELPCTAGFPVVWANVIAQHEVSTLGFGSLLALYLVIYLLDEIIVFLSVAFTLTASRFEERHGRILKLIGGMVMLALALVLLFDPDQMNSVGGSITIFAMALAGSLIVMVLHRRVLPRFGIRIGTEAASPARSKH